ncbi:TetR/AcrR family transcriptional regulator [bacterium M00.F.Ca.ET.228.01.1.1]|uniref:TetR/AcrR family transcriptional regulator n=1 Tax=Paraburkholderia phenoliruptrix TaxID=252970 RepID=UPI0010925833|nr:TetR/AcrR family transcriptional regulator [Paraburkholderia phenoliruptrix]TGP45813.1 TetR/AcrR family transcriptional regulator [bacterium M00.F.Ca.ET.228.01.1.1]TGS04275.1 TetR/AcrR family transcriptional regulator [bacterium M00.F.Ca.ET.191.01.1.1]TGU07106.1 TetR/AcrR family transcriptional regulator [bacterium M00.F.Ca.ET.155.01.1.1]MBW0448498.1 TetR/AcrR family transcriptional regulator [Paraburkholderia phenoliruptrix]MBW9100640.1 TetR/AcrR family transcriptional regulator [Paraburkh
MVRPREFDRDEALDRAMRVFWSKGYAGTSTEDLLAAMEIGRQSLYNAFGDKRKLYLEALERYQEQSIAGHIARLSRGPSALAGIKALLLGTIAASAEERERGCMGVNSAAEFGTADADVTAIRAAGAKRLRESLLARVREAQSNGEIDASMDADEVALFVGATMQSLQLNARAGMAPAALRRLARFAVERLAVGA